MNLEPFNLFSLFRWRQQRRIIDDRMAVPVAVFNHLVLHGLENFTQAVERDRAGGDPQVGRRDRFADGFRVGGAGTF